MLGELSSFSPAVAKIKQNFINNNPLWISSEKDTIVFVLGRNTFKYIDKNNDTQSLDISFVTTNYKVPFASDAKSGYIPTMLLDFSLYQPVGAFFPSIPNPVISKKDLPEGTTLKKWWKKDDIKNKEYSASKFRTLL